MSKEGKDHILIPALIAGVAAYFGFKRKSENVSEIAKDLVSRAIKDQVRTNHKDNQREAQKRRRGGHKRNFRDRYYE